MYAVPQRACTHEWPKKNVIVLILGVRSHSNLWNVFDKTYKDRVKKEGAWEEIKQELDEERNSYATLAFCPSILLRWKQQSFVIEECSSHT